ncbi:MAG TPA: GTP-binding protein [Streptosporangiaceae bacterium]
MSGPAGSGPGTALLTVIGGYLGAGKTTLINRLLAGTGGLRIAVVVNDFGAVGVDARLIRSRTADTIELTNGCLCCSLTDDLAGVMTGLADRQPRFEHVVVELSGVGQPSAMTAWGWFPGFRPGRTVVCADALTGPARVRDRWTGDVVLAQLRAADLVIVTKCDLAGEAAAGEFEQWLATAAPNAAIMRGSADPGAAVLLREASTHAAAAGPGRDAGDDYVTGSATGRGVIPRADLEAFLRALDPGIARVKGIVRLAEAPARRTVVQGVAGRWELTDGGPWSAADEPPRLVLIAPRGDPAGRPRPGLPDAVRAAAQLLTGVRGRRRRW